ncbi:MerR family transcriptional regulator [Albidovulum sp.]|uniref:MerR family transcriptional regulator n=1 Tax=Albidovulum sp. TaxID=1872424 RepID=UPI001DD68B53|nr:MerR family DNA-binding transcriptional regulator [Paracoccaceae bacterium]
MREELMTIREMCEAFGTTARALRFYEAKELLSPQRTGQVRRYGRRERARLKLILRGKRFGFSLEDIRQLLDLYDPGDMKLTQVARTVELARARLAAMRLQRDELEIAITELAQQIALGEAALADRNATTD